VFVAMIRLARIGRRVLLGTALKVTLAVCPPGTRLTFPPVQTQSERVTPPGRSLLSSGVTAAASHELSWRVGCANVGIARAVAAGMMETPL
jgi:hypothetical protein